MSDVYFLDTVFVQALLDKNDQHHEWAVRLFPRVQTAERIVTTEYIFVEVAAALSAINRTGASKFIKQCYYTTNITVVLSDHALFARGLELYENRPDKFWSLVDCLSFVVMGDNNITSALTTDHHYEQAGFQIVKA